MDDTKTIIDLQYEYRIKIEQPDEFRSSLFKKAYASAFQKLSDTLKHRVTNDFDVYNNIICFTGERGRGKTSTMISFKNALSKSENRSDLKNYLNEIQGIDVDEIINKKYLSLSVIDPTIFRGKETLVEIILAQMFSEFKCKIEKPDESVIHDNSNLRKDIIKCFQDVFHHLQYLNSDRINNFEEDSIDALLNLASSTNLRAALQKLIKNYLEFFKKSSYLVICLDDIDLKIEHNYLMLEDIRQTLNSDNIIILTTFKYEQLFESINNHFKNQLLAVVENKGSEERTQFYLNKIFPLSRRVEIGEMNKLFEELQNIEIKNDKKLIFENSRNITPYDRWTEFQYNLLRKNYEEIVREIIFNNIGIFLPRKENRINAILPKTIRELIAFFKFSENRENNLEYLSNYLLTLITTAEIGILQKIKDSTRDHFKVTFINILKEIVSPEDFSNKIVDKSKLQLLLDATNESNISVGDIASLFIILDNSTFGKSNNLFIDVLEFYFCIQSKIKDIKYHSPEVYNGVIKLNSSENGWIIFNNHETFNFESRLFLHYLGKFETKKKYREEIYSPFFEEINPHTRFAVFTPLSLMGNICFNLKNKYPFIKNKNEILEIFDEFELILKKEELNFCSDPIFLKQFLINFKKSNPSIELIKRRIGDSDETSLIPSEYLKLYYQTTYEVVNIMRLTKSNLGITSSNVDEKFVFNKLTARLFYQTLRFLISTNRVIDDIALVQERLTSLLEKIDKQPLKLPLGSFNEFKRQFTKIIKQLEKHLTENNFDNGKLLHDFDRIVNNEISDISDLKSMGKYLIYLMDDFRRYIDNE